MRLQPRLAGHLHRRHRIGRAGARPLSVARTRHPPHSRVLTRSRARTTVARSSWRRMRGHRSQRCRDLRPAAFQTHTSLTVARLQAVAREVGLTIVELLTPDEPAEEPRTRTDMARRLTSLLLHDKRLIPYDHLAEAFNCTTRELRKVAADADDALAGTELRVHVTNNGLALRADESDITDATSTVERLRARDDSMGNGTARVLHQVVTGHISQAQIRKGYGPRLARLHRQGMVEVGRAGRGIITASDDVLFAFDV